ncbi:hypothetical protein MP228_003140 [Amoeboaphelidium protococcarum]|nr:hypothetical protein MP228_003140 [Amoeboaphelidium protococcarum]
MDNVQSDLKPTMLDIFLRNLPQSEFENALFAADLRQTAIVTMDRSRYNNKNNKSNRELTRDISQQGNSLLDDKERRRHKTRIALKKSGYVLDREEIVLKKFSSMPHLALRIEEQSSPQSAKSQFIKHGNNIDRDDSSGCASSPILQLSRDEQSSPSMTIQSEKSVQTRPVQNSIQDYFLPLLHVLQADNIDQAVIRPNQHKRVVSSQDIVLIDEPCRAEVLTDMSLLDELFRQRPVSGATSFSSTLSSTLSLVNNNTVAEDSAVLKSKSSSPVDSSPTLTRSNNTFAQYLDLSSSSPAASSSPSLSSESLQQQQHQIISISQDLIEDVRNKATAPGKSAFDTLYECLDPHL